ncbi:glycoside hydrolase family 15 protein [Halalkalibacter krulwichiae]|uniref:Glycosyl hydrolases family 15 n=1 Tax=Halalkalibacter krulwichiae TaxID=199441 RepID=A0A1X9MG87_9BACI|nr:glycoside hydrolase family 15 protein [Halalkalibacter krulwichiae]ARK30531.1 Glycosyl hydrolases family 15 [Halalkalibacter krulwichiae]
MDHLQQSYRLLEELRQPNHLYLASQSKEYHYFWIRDAIYMSLPYMDKPCNTFTLSMQAILDVFRRYEWKIDIHTERKPQAMYEYIHARYSPDGFEIHNQEWGHAQHDMIGAFLYAVGTSIQQYNKPIIREERDHAIIQKLVFYLMCCRYWEDEDNGMWEEYREVHASSVGACVAGLRAIQPIVFVPQEAIDNGMNTLTNLFPRESVSKNADLAQLSLIYPYQLYQGEEAKQIIKNIEKELLRPNGVIRYQGDSYYSILEQAYGRNKDRSFYYGTEAEWTFGFPWLSLCWQTLNHDQHARYYIERTKEVMLDNGILPEAYFSGIQKPNPNTPLGWSSAMYILAEEKRGFAYA